MSTPQERRLAMETRQLNNLRTELAKEQEKVRAARVEIERDRRVLETEKREWKNKKAKMGMEMERANSMPPQSPSFRNLPRTFSMGNSDSELKVQKLQLALDKMKKDKVDQEGQIRALRRDITNLQRDNRVLNKQLAGKNRGTPQTSTNDTYLTNLSRAQVKRLKIELKIAKKKILKLIKSVRVRKRYFGRQINRFKRDELTWRRDRDRAFQKERVIVKHVFPDDILKIKLTRGQGPVTLVTSDGEVQINPEKVALSREGAEISSQSDTEQLEDILGELELDDVEIDEEDMDESDEDSDSAGLDDNDLEYEMDQPPDSDEEDLKEAPVFPPVFPPIATEEPVPEGHNGYFVGDDVVIHNAGDDHGGTVRYVGETNQSEGDIVYGIELTDGSLGNGNGMVGETMYFECPDMRGVFVKEIRRKMRQKDREEFAARKITRERNLTLRRTSSASRQDAKQAIARTSFILAPSDFDQLTEILNVSHRRAQALGMDALSEDFRQRARENSSPDEGVDIKYANLILEIKAAIERKASFMDCCMMEIEGRCGDVDKLRMLFASDASSPLGTQNGVQQLLTRISDRHRQERDFEIQMTDLVAENTRWKASIARWDGSRGTTSPGVSLSAVSARSSSSRIVPKKVGVVIPSLNPKTPKRWQRTPKSSPGPE